MILLPDKLFIKMVDTALADMIKSTSTSDELVKKISNMIKIEGIPPVKSDPSDWELEDGMLFYKDQCYIPNSNNI